MIKYAGAVDIEAKSLKHNAFILSIGWSVFNVKTLERVISHEVVIDPNCILQVKAGRHVDESTIAWWHGQVDYRGAPGTIAREHTWGGELPSDEAIKAFAEFTFLKLPDPDFVANEDEPWRTPKYYAPKIAMNGPDYDWPVLKTLMEELGIEYNRFFFNKLDSSRTVRDTRNELGLPAIDKNILAKYSPFGEIIEHTAICDSLIEGYELAAHYNLMQKIKDLVPL